MHPDPRRRSTLVPLIALATFGVLAGAGVVGGRHLDGVDERIDRIEVGLARTPQVQREIERMLAAELAEVRSELDAVRGQLEVARASEASARELAGRLAGAESRLTDLAGLIEAHDTSLEVLAETSPSLEERLRDQARTMNELWHQLRDRVEDAQDLAAQSAARVEGLGERDVHRMWNELVGPTVQLSGDESVGSGVLLRSRRRGPSVAGSAGSAGSDGPARPVAASAGPADSGEVAYDTYVLTAWHVVRDIVVGDLEKPVPVAIYAPDGVVTWETATLLAHDAPRDIAVLLLDTDRELAFGAELAPPSRLAKESIFDAIYAVGCPLGNDPIPTPGEIATRRHYVDGVNYWMINAPTYIGNSGGGIFDAETHELLGIFSKIYTHGTLRPTIVPHMGLVTPLDDVYAWLADEGYGFLVPDEPAAR